MRKLFLALCLILALMLPALAENYDPPIARVRGGALRGFRDGDTLCFRGIQYATAERWREPEPISPWKGVKDAQVYGPICPSPPAIPWTIERVRRDAFVFPRRHWVEHEQCLNLNIWTQRLDASAKRPVLVFLHGGDSAIEAYAYDGKNLSEFGDAVVVTVNHRLRVFGCLDLSAYGEAYKNSANLTMLDLVAALAWIRDNIEAFGGDPARVMIFGPSKALLMYRIPAAEGLFSCGADLGGGDATMRPGDSARAAEILLEHFGFDGTQIERLRAIPCAELIEASEAALRRVSDEAGRDVRWGPTADGGYILEGWAEFAKGLPLMIGSTFSEDAGTLQLGSGKNEWSADEISANLRARFGKDAEAVVAEFSRLYPDKPIQDALYCSDRTAVLDSVRACAPVYNYLFALEQPVNGGITAFRGADLTYIFRNVGLSTGDTPACRAVQDAISRAWIDFAATGDPGWPLWSAENHGTMVFDAASRFISLDDEALSALIAAH